jgi:hypothetical protein
MVPVITWSRTAWMSVPSILGLSEENVKPEARSVFAESFFIRSKYRTPASNVAWSMRRLPACIPDLFEDASADAGVEGQHRNDDAGVAALGRTP